MSLDARPQLSNVISRDPRLQRLVARCSACDAATGRNARFCQDCGTALGRRCGACGADATAHARYCARCGDHVNATAGAEAEVLRTWEVPPLDLGSGERRQLTILFCDLVGSTELAAGLDPEDWQDVLRGYQARAGEVIARHGGHLAQHVGAGLLVYFGWPQSFDDAAERAVRAGLALVDAAASLRAGATALRVRVGIHTGPVVVGGDRLALGDVPNTAARIQNAAAAGSVLVSAATQRLVAGLFVVEELEQTPLAGERARVPLYRVVQPSGVRSRLDVAAGRLTRFVGREVELATLVERWERARDGEGQNVLVLGEAGVGKSRLAYQLRERIAAVPHTWLECGASAYTQGTPFHPLIALVSQALAFDAQQTPEQKLAHIQTGLGRLATDEHVALLADFLGLPPPTPIALNPDLQRRRTIELLARWSLLQSEVQPQVLVVEDLHWCDASSLELLGRLVGQSATARMLLLTTARPGFAVPWPARENATTLSLARLTKRQTREMVSALAGSALAKETLDALAARADGVPLFVEELTKSVLQPGAARGVEAIPATLADSLMARLDRLPAAKEVAQRAAVIGREFGYALLAKVSGTNEDALRESLARLCEEEILFVRGTPPDANYVFKHALVQEAAREALLKRTRQQLHGRVVDVLLHDFPERAAAEPELVARHAEAAGRSDVAIVSHRRAGERAQARSAHAEAIHHFELAIALLGAQPESPERDGREAPLQLALAESRSVAIGYTSPQVEAAHERARLLCEAVGDARGLGFALSGLAVFSYNSGRTEHAFELATRELAIAEQAADAELVLRAHADLGLIQVYRGGFESALEHLEASIALAERGARHVEMSATGDPAVRALSASAWALWALGYPDRALARAREGVERARALEHPFNLAHALLFETVTHALRRDVAAQRERAAEVVALSEVHGFPFWVGVGQTFHAAARVAAGDLDAVVDARAGFGLTASTGGRGGAPASLAQLAQAYLMAGRVDAARAAVASGISLAHETAQPVYDSILQLLKARVLLASGADPAEVETLLRRAIEIARGQGARSFELRAATQLAQCLRDRGARDAARKLLTPIYAWFGEGFDTADLVAARELLDTLA